MTYLKELNAGYRDNAILLTTSELLDFGSASPIGNIPRRNTNGSSAYRRVMNKRCCVHVQSRRPIEKFKHKLY